MLRCWKLAIKSAEESTSASCLTVKAAASSWTVDKNGANVAILKNEADAYGSITSQWVQQETSSGEKLIQNACKFSANSSGQEDGTDYLTTTREILTVLYYWVYKQVTILGAQSASLDQITALPVVVDVSNNTRSTINIITLRRCLQGALAFTWNHLRLKNYSDN